MTSVLSDRPGVRDQSEAINSVMDELQRRYDAALTANTYLKSVIATLTRERDEARDALLNCIKSKNSDIEALRTLLAAAMTVLKEVEWHTMICQMCGRFKLDGHTPDYRLASVLTSHT